MLTLFTFLSQNCLVEAREENPIFDVVQKREGCSKLEEGKLG
jgi:hypothetical protein